MISSLLEVASLAGKLSDSASDSADDLKRISYEMSSIAKKAKRSIFQYPTVFTDGVNDIEVAMKINKFLEQQYAIFTLMSSGLNPRSVSDNLDAYLSSFSGENFSYSDIDNIKKQKVNVVFGEKDNMSLEELQTLWDSTRNDLLREYTFSKEADETVVVETTSTDTSNKEDDKKGPKPHNVRLDDGQVSGTGPGGKNKIIEKLASAHPTIIELGVLMGNKNASSDKINLTLAIKGVPHFISNWELMSLFEAAIEEKFVANRFIKLTTGEIKFFRDFVFGFDKAKRDAKLYAQLGRHPWYRRLAERKTKRKFKTFFKILSAFDLFGLFKSFLSGSNNYLPTTSIICSVDELTSAAKMKYSFLLGNQKILAQIMDKLGLLCLGVYDATLGVVNFHLDSFKDPLTVAVKDMKGGDGDATKDLASVMKLMLQRGLL